MQQKPIDDCTDDELRNHANINLGLGVPTNIGRGTLLAKIRQVWQPDFIHVADEEEADLDIEYDEADAGDVKANIRSLRGSSSKNDPKVRLTVAMNESPGGSRDFFVSVNNVAMLVPRGEEIHLPYRYYLVLKNAVSTTFTMDPETFENVPRDVPAYPFSVVTLPTDEEMRGWHEQEHASQYGPGVTVPDLDETMKATARARIADQADKAARAPSQYLQGA